MHPPIGLLYSRPELLCRRQSGLYEPLETSEFVGEPLFWATQAIESEISWSRSFSFNPSASRGGRPSSVSALPDFQAISAHRLGLLIRAPFQGPFNRTYSAYLFFEFFLSMEVCGSNRFGSLTEANENGITGGESPAVRSPPRGSMERCPSVITPAMGMLSCWHTLAASSSSGTRSFSVAPNRLRATSTSPEPPSRSTHNTSCPTSGRPPIERQDHLLVSLEPRLEPLRICQVQRQQFFIAIELIGDCPLGHLEPSSQQFLVNLRDTALLLIPQRPDQGNHIQAKFSVGQCPPAFFDPSRVGWWKCGQVVFRHRYTRDA